MHGAGPSHSPGPPTIYDVAEHAQVSIATVSRALNGHGYLRGRDPQTSVAVGAGLAFRA